jgi:uncharacterized membrane protein
VSTQKNIDVDVDISTVYNQWTQFTEFPQFMNGVDTITQTDDTHQHWVTSIAGVTREFDTVITEQHPDERVAWKSVEGTGHAGVVTFHRLGDNQTRVMVQLDMAPEGLAEKAADKLGVVDHQVTADLKRFKTFIENRSSETGGWRGDVSRPN